MYFQKYFIWKKTFSYWLLCPKPFCYWSYVMLIHNLFNYVNNLFSSIESPQMMTFDEWISKFKWNFHFLFGEFSWDSRLVFVTFYFCTPICFRISKNFLFPNVNFSCRMKKKCYLSLLSTLDFLFVCLFQNIGIWKG